MKKTLQRERERERRFDLSPANAAGRQQPDLGRAVDELAAALARGDRQSGPALKLITVHNHN